MKTLVVGIYNDFMGLLSDRGEHDEYNDICGVLQRRLTDFDLMFIKLSTLTEADSHSLDILVADYGGLNLCMGCDNSRLVAKFSLYLHRYIEDHPSTAVVIFSKMTETNYCDEVEEIGEEMCQHAPNVFLYDRKRSDHHTTKLSVNQNADESLGEALERFIEGE